MLQHLAHTLARPAATALVAVLGMLALAHPAQAQAGRPLPGAAHVDPISFRAPDPTEQFGEIYIEQKLDNQVPLDLVFQDESGANHTLKEYMDGKPVVLALVYYECPNVCSVIINAVLSAVDAAAMKLNLGSDFNVLCVSIDPGESPELATEKKANYRKLFHKEGWDNGFRFLTSTEDNVQSLATAVGYRYYYDKKTDQYAHASGIMVLTPDGKVSSYYLGTEYLPKVLQFAVADAAKGVIGPLVDQVVMLCFKYDPAAGAYGFYILNAVRLAAAVCISALVIFWIVMWLRDRNRPDPVAPVGHDAQPHAG